MAFFPTVADSMTNSERSPSWSEYAPDPKPLSLVQVNKKKSELQTGKRSVVPDQPPYRSQGGRNLGWKAGFPTVIHHQVGFPHSPLLQRGGYTKAEGNGLGQSIADMLEMCCVRSLKNTAMNFCFLPQLENGRYYERQATSVCSQCKKK